MPNAFPDQFFYCDKNNCESFTNHIYGWGLVGDKFYCNEDLEKVNQRFFQTQTVNGAYCVTDKKDGFLEIFNDPTGFGAIYVYMQPGGDYWALSNSIWLLIEGIKARNLPLTLNMGVAAQMFRAQTPITDGDTVCREITIAQPFARAEINLKTRTLALGIFPVSKPMDVLNTGAYGGMPLIDAWINKWLAIIRGVDASGCEFISDITGGFDSRLSLALALASGLNLDQINLHFQDDLPLTEADNGDAKSIDSLYKALQYPSTKPISQYPIGNEQANLCYNYAAKYLCKDDFNSFCAKNNHFHLTGFVGELMRGLWDAGVNEYLQLMSRPVYGKKLAQATEASFLSAMNYAKRRTYREHNYPMLRLVRASRFRWHFGRATTRGLLTNTIFLSPCADPMLLQLDMSGAPDYDIFFAIVMDRIGKQIKDVPYCNDKRFSQATRDLAAWLNKKFPFKPTDKVFDFGDFAKRPPFYTYNEQNDSQSYADWTKEKAIASMPVFSRYFNPVILEHELNQTPLAHRNFRSIIMMAELMEYAKPDPAYC